MKRALRLTVPVLVGLFVGMSKRLPKWRVVGPDAAVGTTMEKASTTPLVEQDISLKAEVSGGRALNDVE